MDFIISNQLDFFENYQIDSEREDFGEFRTLITNSLRNIYALESEGLLPRTVRKRVYDQIARGQNLEGVEQILKQLIEECHDYLRQIGELVEIESEMNPRRFRLSPPTFVVLAEDFNQDMIRCLLLGPQWNFPFPTSKGKVILEENEGTRFIVGDASDAQAYFANCGIAQLSFEQWTNFSPRFTPLEVLQLARDTLTNSQSRAITILDFKILEKGHHGFFKRRQRPVKKNENGMYLVRQPHEYGGDGSYLGLFDNGTCTHLISLPIAALGSTERDSERLILLAMDVLEGNASKVKVDGPKRIFVRRFDKNSDQVVSAQQLNYYDISLYVPPMEWVLKYLLSVGTPTDRAKGALLTFTIHADSLQAVLSRLATDMFLEVQK